MKKLILAVIVLSIGYFTLVKAEEQSNKIEAFGTKVSNHISMEIEKTKEYQKKNWAITKAQLSKLFSKFQAKKD